MDHSHHNHNDHIGHPIMEAKSEKMMMHHALSFHFGTSETILFDFWKIESSLGMIISCFIVVLLAFVMETIRFFREYRRNQFEAFKTPLAAEDRLKISIRFDLIDAILQLIQLTFAYFLMLIFMTFNVYLCIFTVLGEVISYFLFHSLFSNLSTSISGHC